MGILRVLGEEGMTLRPIFVIPAIQSVVEYFRVVDVISLNEDGHYTFGVAGIAEGHVLLHSEMMILCPRGQHCLAWEVARSQLHGLPIGREGRPQIFKDKLVTAASVYVHKSFVFVPEAPYPVWSKAWRNGQIFIHAEQLVTSFVVLPCHYLVLAVVLTMRAVKAIFSFRDSDELSVRVSFADLNLDCLLWIPKLEPEHREALMRELFVFFNDECLAFVR